MFKRKVYDYLKAWKEESDGMYKRSSYSSLSDAGFAYSLYKYGNSKGIKSLRVSDFYEEDCEGGPAKEFCLTKSDMEKMLRSLNSANNRILIAELNMGVDNISLTKDLSPLEIVKLIID